MECVTMCNRNVVVRERIVHAALDLFRRYGIKTVTMDDVASALGMSKRTLYEQMGSKEAVLIECIRYRVDKDCILKHAESHVTDMLLDCVISLSDLQKSIDRRCLWEIRKYYGGAYDCLTHIIDEYAEMCMGRVARSIEEGYIRHDVSPHLVYTFLRDRLSKLFSCEECGVNGFDERAIASMVLVFARGISTEKGQAYMDEKLRNRVSGETNQYAGR